MAVPPPNKLDPALAEAIGKWVSEAYQKIAPILPLPTKDSMNVKLDPQLLREFRFQLIRSPQLFRDFVENTRTVTGAGLGMAAATRFALGNAIKAVPSVAATAAKGFAAACAGASAGELAVAGGLGLLLGYGIVRSGAGHYMGLESAGNFLGEKAAEVFGPSNTQGAAFQAFDRAFSFLGLS